MPERFELRGADVTEVAVTAFDVVEVVDVIGHGGANSRVVAHLRVLSSSTCIRPQNDSMAALSKQSPTVRTMQSQRRMFSPKPGGELRAVVGVQNRWAYVSGVARHVDRVVDQRGVGGGGKGACHDHPRETIQDSAAVDLAVAGGMFGDVGAPQFVGESREAPVHQVGGSVDPDRFGSRRPGSRQPEQAASAMIESTSLWLTFISYSASSAARTRRRP